MDNLEPLGSFESRGDSLDMRFERFYPRAIEKVWSALTDPVRLQDWMGAAYVDGHVGGRYELMLDGPNPMRGRVRVWDPPHVLEFAWSNTHAPDSVARYELSREQDGVRLIFTHRGAPFLNRALMLPGWHLFFERLDAWLADGASRRARRDWREMQAIYVERYAWVDVRLDP